MTQKSCMIRVTPETHDILRRMSVRSGVPVTVILELLVRAASTGDLRFLGESKNPGPSDPGSSLPGEG